MWLLQQSQLSQGCKDAKMQAKSIFSPRRPSVKLMLGIKRENTLTIMRLISTLLCQIKIHGVTWILAVSLFACSINKVFITLAWIRLEIVWNKKLIALFCVYMVKV